jgi:peptide/nickel transport system ATP-binding protein
VSTPAVSPLNEDGFNVLGLTVQARQENDCWDLVRDVGLSVRLGSILGLVGESGSGKTTTVLSAIGAVPRGVVVTAGRSQLNGRRVLGANRRELRDLWRHSVSYVPQDAAGSLNPAYRVGTLLSEVLVQSGRTRPPEARRRAIELLEQVRIREPSLISRCYPHQLSGGQLQRVVIAMALACGPQLLVLDEPGTGLDATTLGEVLAMLSTVVRELQVATIYVSHDLALLAGIADSIAVMYSGEVVEAGPAARVTIAPKHPYTCALLSSVLSTSVAVRPVGLAGRAPGRVVDEACAFQPRCAHAVAACAAAKPTLDRLAGDERLVRCFRVTDLGSLRPTRTAIHSPLGRERAAPLLVADQLSYAHRRSGNRAAEPAVDGVSLAIGGGEIVALVGESGSGKTTIARMLAGVLSPDAGKLYLRGTELAPEVRHRSSTQQRAIQLVFQDANASLNPRQRVSRIVGRAAKLFRPDLATGADRRRAVLSALDEVHLDPAVVDRYPHQLSGGQRQRVALARAFITQPELVVADEIVSNQDVSLQAALLDLLLTMQRAHGTSVLFITHDLGVVRSVAQYLYVLRRGAIVEEGIVEGVFDNPQHEYTASLLGAARAREAAMDAVYDSPM